MRLLYQSFGDIDRTPPYKRKLQELVETAAAPGTEITIQGLRNAVLAGKQFRPFQDVDTAKLIHQLMESGPGFDAVILGNTMDPGITAARQLFDEPVLGLFSTSLALASLLGRRSVVICSNPIMIPRIREQIRVQGADHQVAHLGALGATNNVPSMAAAFSDREAAQTLCDAFLAEARAFLPRDVDVVIPASGILQVLLWAHGIDIVDEAPVINGVAASVIMAEALVRLRTTFGNGVSHRAAYTKVPDSIRGLLTERHDG